MKPMKPLEVVSIVLFVCGMATLWSYSPALTLAVAFFAASFICDMMADEDKD